MTGELRGARCAVAPRAEASAYPRRHSRTPSAASKKRHQRAGHVDGRSRPQTTCPQLWRPTAHDGTRAAVKAVDKSANCTIRALAKPAPMPAILFYEASRPYFLSGWAEISHGQAELSGFCTSAYSSIAFHASRYATDALQHRREWLRRPHPQIGAPAVPGPFLFSAAVLSDLRTGSSAGRSADAGAGEAAGLGS